MNTSNLNVLLGEGCSSVHRVIFFFLHSQNAFIKESDFVLHVIQTFDVFITFTFFYYIIICSHSFLMDKL